MTNMPRTGLPAPRHGVFRVIERHIRFSVSPEAANALQAFLADSYIPAASETEGFASARVLQSGDKDDETLLVLEFADAAASARWRESDTHQALAPKLGDLHDGMDVKGYESA